MVRVKYNQGMDESKLNTFMTVYEKGSFTSAAEILFLSPIAVKKQIDALEALLNGKLFTRSSTGCIPTPLGDIFRQHARKIINDIEVAKREIEKQNIVSRGEIIAGHNITFNYRFLGSLSAGFYETGTNCIIQFEKHERDQLFEMLIKRQINCIFAESTLIDDPAAHNMTFYPLISVSLYAIMNKGNHLADRDIIRIDDLSDEEVYTVSILDADTLRQLKNVTGDRLYYIENTDRNVLFNRIIKGAVEIYPKDFSYYRSIPLDVNAVQIGIYTLNNKTNMIHRMVQFVQNYITDCNLNAAEIF